MADPKPHISDTAVGMVADGLMDFLKAAAGSYPDFNNGLRDASTAVADHVVGRVRVQAGRMGKHGPNVAGSSGRSQAQVVADAIKARRDRIPKIGFSKGTPFKSSSRPNSKRKHKVSAGDVYFGAEHGGRRRKTTQQFLRHQGRNSYFFWQAVSDSKSFIAKEYSNSIDRVLKSLAPGAR